MTIVRVLARLAGDSRATSTIEFAIICGMIVIALIAAVRGVADETTGLWATVARKSSEAHEKVQP